MTTLLRRSPVLGVGFAVGVLMGAAELVRAADLVRAAVVTLIPVAYALIVGLLARRNEGASVLAGRPVDERWEHIGLEASTWAFGASATLVLAAFVLVRLQGGDWGPYALVGVAMAVAYVGSLTFVHLRH